MYEYDERLATTYAAKTHGELAAVTADLPATDAAQEGRATVQAAIPGPRRGELRTRMLATWCAWLAASAITTGVWLADGVSSEFGDFLPIWVIMPWGLLMLIKTLGVGVAAFGHGRHLDRH
ncbi:MAG: DUF1707 SHOCT-like domain-containing protein [Micromonosporaceae bacterium]